MTGARPGGAATFPFVAVVGHDDVKLALILNAIDPHIGGVLLRGQKGSAKSTLARGLAALLPGAAPFVDLPVGATDDRLVGTLDLEAALTGGGHRFQPGLLAEAHGGVLYVDEVNLLPDHLVDVLLDVAASGVNRVEREGVSESHPARFVLAGSMNPEEGDLRPQLLDRFGLAADVTSSLDPATRAEAVRRRLTFDADPAGFAARWRDEEEALRARIATAAPVALPSALVEQISGLCAQVGAEGLRADLVICRGAAALAGWEGRAEATVEDVRRVAPLALAHRRRRSPLDDHGIDQDEIDDALDAAADSRPPPPSPEGAGACSDGPAEGSPPEGAGQPDDEPGPGGAPERTAGAGTPTKVIPLATGRTDPTGRDASGRRSTVEGPRGRLIGDRAPDGPVTSLAVGATVRAAARRGAIASSGPASAVAIERGDLRQAVREQRAGRLIVLAVDASGSMGVQQRMEAVKGAVLSLLLDAYQRRDRIALVTFRGEEATVALRPTGSVEVARARLASLPSGGRTPLAAGIETALAVAAAAGGPGGTHRPLLVLLSDGRATAAPAGGDPVEAALAAAARVRQRGVEAIVVDAESGPTRLGLAADVAAAMGGRCLTVPDLSAGALDAAIRHTLATP